MGVHALPPELTAAANLLACHVPCCGGAGASSKCPSPGGAVTDVTRGERYLIQLTTKRCLLRPISRLATAELLHAMWSSSGVRRFLWDGEVIQWREHLPRSSSECLESRLWLVGHVAERLAGTAERLSRRGCGLSATRLSWNWCMASPSTFGGGLFDRSGAGADWSTCFGSLDMPFAGLSTGCSQCGVDLGTGEAGLRPDAARSTVGGSIRVFYELQRCAAQS